MERWAGGLTVGEQTGGVMDEDRSLRLGVISGGGSLGGDGVGDRSKALSSNMSAVIRSLSSCLAFSYK